MRITRQLVWLIVVSWVLAWSVELASGQSYRGLGFELGGIQDNALIDESLLNLRQIGGNAIAIDVNLSQELSTDNQLTGPLDDELAQVGQAIDLANDRGLQVFVRPRVRVESSAFASSIQPNNVEVWFENYGAALQQVALLANDKDVAMLSVGSTLNGLEQHVDRWTELIAGIRGTYSGHLTYEASHAPDFLAGGGFEELEWWTELDAIGVNAFFDQAFSQDFNAPPDALLDGANDVADIIGAFHEDGGYSQKVVFTDIGFSSVDGAAVFPFNDGRGGDPIDLEEQQWAYEAVLSVMGDQSWWDGSFWRGWQADPHAGGPSDLGYSPQGKPAERVLAESFGGRPNFVLQPSLIESWEDGFNDWSLPDSPPSQIGALELETDVGNTNGETSLSLPSGNSSDFVAARVWAFNTGNDAYAIFEKAVGQPEDYVIAFDVTVDKSLYPDAERAEFRLNLEDDRDRPSIVAVAAELGGDGIQTREVIAPISEFTSLNQASIWYELQFATDNAWSGAIQIDNLRVRSNVAGDVTNDARLTVDDIDALHDAIRDQNSAFDVNGDGVLDEADRVAWFELTGTVPGDFDLNGTVEFLDFIALASNFGEPGNWLEGDATGDRSVDFLDFLLLANNFGQSGQVVMSTPVPEPTLPHWCLFAVFLVVAKRMRTRQQCPN